MCIVAGGNALSAILLAHKPDQYDAPVGLITDCFACITHSASENSDYGSEFYKCTKQACHKSYNIEYDWDIQVDIYPPGSGSRPDRPQIGWF